MKEVDWESLEKTYGFLFKDSIYSKMSRNIVKMSHNLYPNSEEIVISVSAYEKFGHLTK